MKEVVLCFFISLAIMSPIDICASNQAVVAMSATISSIATMSISGNPSLLHISDATAGLDPTPVSDTSTSYALTTNQENMKVTGALDSGLPLGITLSIEMTAPSGAISMGTVSLSPSTADLVTGISHRKDSNLTISYTLAATVEAGTLSTSQRTVTLTLTNGG